MSIVPASEAPRPVIQGEVVEDPTRVVYERTALDALLEAYAFGSNFVPETEIDQELALYAIDVATLTVSPTGQVNVGLVFQAFRHVFNRMNEVAEQKHGSIEPKTLEQILLEESGLAERHTYVRPLDKQYWATQFMQQYKSQAWVKRFPGESEASYAARYIHRCLHGFALAPFSYAV